MIKHILKIIWNQRRSNVWIFMELLLVVAIFWVMMDSLFVDVSTYKAPLGFDITNVYKVNLGKISPDVPGYVPDELHQTSDGEDLIRLVDNLRQNPKVEEASLAYAACPYSWNTSWSSLIQAEADTTQKANTFQRLTVQPSYYDVFRFTDQEGHPLRPIVEQHTGELVITADMEKDFWNGQAGAGRQVKVGSTSNESITVAAVSTPIRRTEYDKSEPCFYLLWRSDKDVIDAADWAQAQNMECFIRMKDGFRAEDMEAFLQQMSDRLTVNNLYVSSVKSLQEMRTSFLKPRTDNLTKKSVLIGFMLVNVFFGIVGTFWLRTQYRRGELGLRAALGASRSKLKQFMNVEGLCLLSFTVPLVLIFIVNMLYFDMPDTYRQPYSLWRFLVTFGGTCLLLAGMIWVGIWFPAQKIAKMDPAESLHYE
ncbi:ABC transporter permease [Parabacteroides sp. AF48-14]|uniref:ABC transporter permease n=1 Tax=Parabacteroides sp. AF48-14 TaxID=2292052 RepID=UPI000F00DBFA|nr:FtsX-like permease family protein [Parabacteroides sp. AF48-14]RHO69184.1 ABC transporter permease [Parabacteroides sp. AF48-14]